MTAMTDLTAMTDQHDPTGRECALAGRGDPTGCPACLAEIENAPSACVCGSTETVERFYGGDQTGVAEDSVFVCAGCGAD